MFPRVSSWCFAGAVSAGLLWLPAPVVEAAQPGERPNVVLIVADDLGYGDVGLNGSTLIRTPNIDALAASGINFTSGYVTASVCAPSRAGLFTGRHQQEFGYEFNPRERAGIGVPENVRMIPDVLREAGYRTGLIGKWHLGETTNHHPQNRGFDEFFGFVAGSNGYFVKPGPGDEWMVDPVTAVGATRWSETMATLNEGAGWTSDLEPMLAAYRKKLPQDDPMAGFRTMQLERGFERLPPREGYLTDLLSEEAVGFIERHRDQPFFLTVTHLAPHSPLHATAEHLEPYRHVEEQATRIYAAMVSALDAGVGRVVSALERNGLRDRTLVVFLSDNGCAPYVPPGSCSNAPFKGFKGSYFEGGVRIPMVASWPGRLPAGITDETPTVSFDWTVTALALAGLPWQNQGYAGTNLMPRLEATADAGEPPARSTVAWRTAPNYAIRDGRWKLVVMERVDGNGFVRLLYDLTEDPSESDDLSDERPEQVQRLQSRFEAWSGRLPESPAHESQRVFEIELPDGVEVRLYN